MCVCVGENTIATIDVILLLLALEALIPTPKNSQICHIFILLRSEAPSALGAVACLGV